MRGDKRTVSMREASVGAALLFGAAVACRFGGEDVRVVVDCVGGDNAVTCDVVHRSGGSRARACWELDYDCANGTDVTGGFCHEVSPGERSQKVIPLSQLKNANRCDQVTSSRVTNVQITAL